MLSIIPFDRVGSSAAAAAAQSSSGREAERPFKAYPRVPVTLPTNSFYGPFTPPTFVGSVNIPASHTSASLKRLEESSHHHHSRHHSNSSSMDPMSPHQYNSLMQSSATADHMPHLMDISSGGQHSSGLMRLNAMSSASSTSHHSHQAAIIKQEPQTPTGLTPSSLHPHHHTHAQQQQHYAASTSHNGAAGGSSAAAGGSPPGGAHNTAAAGSGSTSDSSPGGSSDQLDDDRSHMPPKKRPLSVPEESKDVSYWEKRKKNNESAKRSRDARRMKEEQIAMRVVYLEQENLQLRTEVSLLKSEIEKLRCMLYNS